MTYIADLHAEREAAIKRIAELEEADEYSAVLIAELEAERDRLVAENEALIIDRDMERATEIRTAFERDKLREALEPFAIMSVDGMSTGTATLFVTFEDIRRARAALAKDS